MQTFTGFAGQSGSTWDDIISFTGSGPDIAFKTTVTGSTGDNGKAGSGSGNFDASVSSVAAAAFTLSNLTLDGASDAQTATAIFFNDAGTALSTQTLSGAATAVNGLFAHIATGGETISRIRLTANFGAGFNSSTSFGVDDIGLAPVPEPSASLLLLGGISFLAIRRRRF